MVEPGTPHRFWNAGEDEVRFVCEVRPALQFESLLETMFALAEDGKTNRKGMPNPLRLAVIARRTSTRCGFRILPRGSSGRVSCSAAPLGRPSVTAHVHARGQHTGHPCGLMKRHFYFTLLVLALILLALPGFAAKAAKRAAGPALRFA